jgi:CRISPR-associated exonuclease Cas4
MIAAALAVLAVAVGLWWWAGRSQGATGLPRARVLAQDTERGRPVDAPLVSHRHRLVGRPDYLLEHGGAVIPVEVKPGRQAAEPYQGDLLQVWAYCLLVEETYGHAPPHGLLRYADQTWLVPWDPTACAAVLAALDDLAADAASPDVPRSHQQPARCAGCGVRAECDERLA